MSWTGIFKEAATVGKREITVKRSAYDEKDAIAIETWSDVTLFKVRGLNHLRVSGFPAMLTFSPLIAQLDSLLELLLVENGLTTLPEELGTLTKLRVLDVSNNKLTTLPDSFYNLSSLQTLLVSHNQLTVDSFPSCTSQDPFPSIQYLDLTGNRLTGLPDFVYTSVSLLELKASHNMIETIDQNIGSLSSLKSIEMHENALRVIPSQLSQCSKLKSLIFDGNPLTDPRLRKVLTQFGSTKPKAVLDYLAANKSRNKGGGKKKGKGKGKQVQESDSEEDDTGATPIDKAPTLSNSKTSIVISRPERFIEVKAMNSARQVRPYLVCVIIRDLELSDDYGDGFRRFITLQTKLHETVCKRRRVATIATHSLDAISPPIAFKSAMAHKINFCPLEWREKTTARKFLDHLKANRPEDQAKKEGAGKPYSIDAAAAHLSKFLSMVDPSQMVYLQDSSNTVISLPPLANSENTKLTESTRNVFIEVTSSTSLADAKMVMDTLLLEMAQSKILSKHVTDPAIGEEMLPPLGACLTTPTPKLLSIEPVKVIDEANKLLVYYPSRNDLTLDERLSQTIQLIRPN